LLPGIVVKPLKTFADERGFLTEIFRSSWKEVLSDEVAQANLSVTYPNTIRAWHKHQRGQTDCFVAAKGAVKICAYDQENGDLDEIISTGAQLQIVRIPGHYWHGFKAMGNEPAYLVYFVNKPYDAQDPDEVRRPWNDPKIIPKKVNGRGDDPRCGKPWDWLALPHR